MDLKELEIVDTSQNLYDFFNGNIDICMMNYTVSKVHALIKNGNFIDVQKKIYRILKLIRRIFLFLSIQIWALKV